MPPPTAGRLSHLLRRCAAAGALRPGVQHHAQALVRGHLSHAILETDLVLFYCSFGVRERAREVFYAMPTTCSSPFMHTYNILLTASPPRIALDLLISHLLAAGIRPDRYAIPAALPDPLLGVPSVLNVCGKDGELMKGMEIHGRMVWCLAFDLDVPIRNALIDMYAKCGCVDVLQVVFAGMQERNVVSWSTLISCYGVHGKGEEALRVHEEMVSQGVKLNFIAFTSALSSCSHSRLVTEGRTIFESMCKVHGVEPTAEHYACMVDLLGRAGAIEEAVGLIRRMPTEPCASVWELCSLPVPCVIMLMLERLQLIGCS